MKSIIYKTKEIVAPDYCCVCNSVEALVDYNNHKICKHCEAALIKQVYQRNMNLWKMLLFAALSSPLILPPFFIIYHYMKKYYAANKDVKKHAIFYNGERFGEHKYTYGNSEYAESVRILNDGVVTLSNSKLSKPSEVDIFVYEINKVIDYARQSGDKKGAIAQLRQAKKELSYAQQENNAHTQLKSANSTMASAFLKNGNRSGQFARANARQKNAKFKLAVLERSKLIDNAIATINNFQETL